MCCQTTGGGLAAEDARGVETEISAKRGMQFLDTLEYVWKLFYAVWHFGAMPYFFPDLRKCHGYVKI